jgi:outer membrane biosynthesis protein TonB
MKKKVRIYQMGGAQAMQNVGNMQTGPSDDELINAAMSMIGEQNASPDDVLNAFVKNGIQPDKANQVIGLVVQHINNETELGNAQVADSDNRAELEEEEMLKQEEANRIAEEDARRKQMYQEMYADQGSANYSDDDQVAMDMLMKYGGMPNKKSFVKNVMSLTKKQMGGDSNASNSVDDKSFGRKESGLDAFVKAAQNSANNALIKKDAETMYSNLQSYFQDGGDVESGIADFGPYHNLAHYSDTFEHAMPNYETDIVQAQFGGMRPGQQRRMQRRVNRMIGQVPAAMYNSRQTMFPQGINIMTMPMMGPQGYSMPARGVYQGGPQLANIDVRKVGLFGKPKEYTITFAQEAYYNPQLRQNVIRQEEVNQEETVKEIAEEQKATETNTATTENKEVLAETAKTSNGTTSTIPVKKRDVPKKEALETSVIRDDWGRPIGDEWFGFNPETKKFKNVNTVQEVIDRANKANRNNTSINLSDYQQATADQYSQSRIPTTLYNTGSDNVVTGIDPTNPYDYGAKAFSLFMGQSKSNPFTFKEMPKGYLPGQRGLPSPKGGFSSPGNWGGGPKGLPPGPKGYIQPGQRMLNPPPGFQYKMAFQQGGFTDQDSGLYRFINGGNELGIPQVNGKITDDPYFQYGGYFQTAGQTDSTPVEIIDNQGNVVRQTTLADAEKNNLRHRVITSNTQNTNSNKKRYDALKELGYNVGDFREGVDYSKMGNKTTTQQQQQQQQNYYNPQIGAMYPPLFGGRRSFRPPGRAIEYAGSWLQQQGLPIDPRTGQPIQGIVNPQLKSIDVTKSSLLRKLPKKYTMNFTGQAPEGTGFGTFNTGFQPRKNWNTSETPTADNVPSQGPSIIGTADKNESRLKGLYRRMTEKGFSYEDENQPESILPPPNYTDEELEKLGMNKIVDVQPESFYSEADQQEMLRNMAPNSEVLPAPNYSDAELRIDQMTDVTPEVFNTPNQENTNMFMQTRPAQALDQFINNEQLISPEYYSEDGLLGEDIQGPLNEKYSLMEQDPMNTGMNLLSVPNDYYFNQANQNSLNRQNFDLNQMYEQDPNYYNRAPYNTPLDFDSFDYTQQVGPTAPVINLPAKSSVQKRNIAKQQEKIKNETKKEVKEKNKLVKSQTKPTQNETKPTQNKNNAPLGPGGPRTDKYEAQAQREKNEMMKADRELYTLYLREYRDNNKTMSEFKKDNPAAYNRMFGNGKYQYGGNLPQAQVGVSNPALMPSAESMMTNPFALDSNYKNPLSGNAPAIRMGTDGEYVNEGVLTDEDLAKLNQRDMSVDYKVKNMYNVDFERGVNQVNRGINQGLAMFGERGDRQRRADMQNNLTADNLYGNTGIQNRGTYETNSGLFRPDEMGFTGIVRNGGFMQEGGDVYGEDDETWMSEEQIRQFLAEGGELEFI